MPTTATTRIIPAQLRDKGGAVYNVMHPDFGATGLNSIDDAPAFAAALAALPTKGGTIYVPPGNYKIASNIQFTPDATAFDGGFVHLKLAPGARLVPTSAVTELISFNHAVSQEAWIGISGGVLDGTSAAAGAVGIGIHTQNVKVRNVVVKKFSGAGLKYVFDLTAPPICSELAGLSLLFNKIGVNCTVTAAAGLLMQGCRVEGSDEEGAIFDGCGHITLLGNTIETNGFVTASKPNLRLKNSVEGLFGGNYFESNAYQDHSSVVIEGVTAAPQGIAFIGNRVVGYYQNASLVALANSIGLDIAPGTGAVDGVVEYGNYFVGQTVAVRNGTNSRGFRLGPDAFSDSFNPAGANQTRYSRVSTLAGQVSDVNRFANTVYQSSVQESPTLNTPTFTGVATGAGGFKPTGGTSVDGSIVKQAAQGLLFRGIAGSTADGAYNGAGGTAVWQNPTGTTVFEVFATIKNKTATITYSTSMTPNADAGEIQKITVTDGVAFAINAPTNPRLGQRLAIRVRNISGGAHGAITPNAIYKLTGGAWPVVANGSSKTLVVDYDGTNWVEQYRSAADVPN